MSILERFWAKVDKTVGHGPNGDCWLWMAGKNKTGLPYGSFSVTSRRRIVAHRFSWSLRNGEIPEGKLICHRCDNPPCVNPDHLWVGTHLDNNRDMMSKGRNAFNNPCGRISKHRKLSYETADQARMLVGYGLSQTSVARLFGVSQQLVSRTILEEVWNPENNVIMCSV